MGKNINRIINLDNFVEFPFPKIENIVYETKIKDNMKFNTPVVQEKAIKVQFVGTCLFTVDMANLII